MAVALEPGPVEQKGLGTWRFAGRVGLAAWRLLLVPGKLLVFPQSLEVRTRVGRGVMPRCCMNCALWALGVCKIEQYIWQWPGNLRAYVLVLAATAPVS